MINIPIKSNWLNEQAKTNSDISAIIYNDKKLTYLELYEEVKQRTQELIASGIGVGNRVGVYANPSPQFVIDIFAVWNLGAVVFPINTQLSQNEIVEQTNFIGCRIIGKPDSSFLDKNLYTFGNEYPQKETALILFTSGSTGQNKAVKHSFKSLYSSAHSIDKIFNFSNSEKWLASLPFYRIGGFQIIVRSVLAGGTLIIPKLVTTQEIETNISKYKPHYMSLVNASLKSLIENDKLKSAKAIFVGGGPIDSSLLLKGVKKSIPLYKVYGSTETGSMVTLLDANTNRNKIDSVGKPLNGVEIKVDDDEILINSESLFSGYLTDKEIPAQKIAEGWFATGDEGFIDKEGFLFINGRLDNLIISGGEKINPAEIESRILEIDGIKEVKVIGLEDEKWGEKVCAVITSNEEIDTTQIADNLREKLPAYKVPKEIRIIDKMPFDEMGKVDIGKLRNLF